METQLTLQKNPLWIEESLQHYYQFGRLREELIKTKRLAKLFVEISDNQKFRIKEFDGLKEQIFEIILQRAIDNKCKYKIASKVVRAISSIDTQLLEKSRLIFLIDSYRVEENLLLWATKSAFIRAMASHPFSENLTKQILLKDCTYHDFKTLSEFVHEKKLPQKTVSQTISILKCADFFQMKKCVTLCLNELIDNLTIKTFCVIFNELAQNMPPELFKGCQEFLDNYQISLKPDSTSFKIVLHRNISSSSIKIAKKIIKKTKFNLDISPFINGQFNTHTKKYCKKKIEILDMTNFANENHLSIHLSFRDNNFDQKNYSSFSIGSGLLDKITHLKSFVTKDKLIKHIFKYCPNITNFSGILNDQKLKYLRKFCKRLESLELLEGSLLDPKSFENFGHFNHLKKLTLSREIKLKDLIPVCSQLANLQQLSVHAEGCSFGNLKHLLNLFQSTCKIHINGVSNIEKDFFLNTLKEVFSEINGYLIDFNEFSTNPIFSISKQQKRKREPSEKKAKKQIEPSQKKIRILDT